MDVADFRHLSTTSLTLAVGPVRTGPDASAGGLGAARIVAHPYVTGPYNEVLTQARLQTSTADSQCMLRLAVYARTSASNRYPGALIADLGSHFCASATAVMSFTAMVASANDLWWIAFSVNSSRNWTFNNNTGAPIVWGAERTDVTGGMSGALTTSFNVGSCWPTTFPASATVAANDVPCIGFVCGSFA